MKKKDRIVTIIFFIILLTITALVTHEVDQSLATPEEQNKNSYQKDVKYVPLPNDLKKYEGYPWEILKLPDFSKAYRSILGPRIKEKWLKLMDGPSYPNEMIVTPQGNFVVIHSCKQHYCETHFILILFDSFTKQCWGLLVENGMTVWLGSPDNEMKALLKKVERITWPNAPSNRIN